MQEMLRTNSRERVMDELISIDPTLVSQHEDMIPIPLEVISFRDKSGKDAQMYVSTQVRKSGTVTLIMYGDRSDSEILRLFIASFEATYVRSSTSGGYWTIGHRDVKSDVRSKMYPHDIAHFGLALIETMISKASIAFGLTPRISVSSARPSVVRMFQKHRYTVPQDNDSQASLRLFTEYMRLYKAQEPGREKIPFLNPDPAIGSRFLLVKRDHRDEILIDKRGKGYRSDFFLGEVEYVKLTEAGIRAFVGNPIPCEIRVHFEKTLASTTEQ